MIYPVHERFDSFQGEGVHAGRSAYFIRLFGCPVHCPWCDSAGTWHPEYVPKDVERVSAGQIVLDLPPTCQRVVITGGEPCIHDLTELTKILRNADIQAHLETSGAFPIRGDFDWITLSPKKWKPPIMANLMRADEIKIIVEEPADIPLYRTMVKLDFINHQHVWLHPEWGKRNDPAVLAAIVNAVKNKDPRYRAGWQLHKLFQADNYDPNSKKPVPLGGDPGRGY